ncbi:MAG: peptidoglycan DD-metalloendopeptidase family protein [Ornithinibacter sp.]
MGRSERALLPAPRRVVAIGVSLTCAVAMLATSAQALPTGRDPGTEKRKVDAQVEQLKGQLEDTNADLSAAYIALRATQDKLPAARVVLQSAQAAAAAADQANAVAAQELEVAVANEKKAQAELGRTTKEISSSRTKVAQFAAQIYQEQGFGQLDMALSSTDPQQFADRIALVDTVMDVQGETMDRLATEQASLTALEDQLSALRADSAAKKRKAEDALARATSARGAAEAAKAQLDSLASQQQQQAQEVEGQLASDQARLVTAETEQSRLKAILVQRALEAKRKAEAARKAAAARKAEAARKAAQAARKAEEAARKAEEARTAEEAARRASASKRAAAHKKAEAARRAADAAAKAAGEASSASSGSSASAGSSGSSGSSQSSDNGYLSRPVRTGWVSSEYGMRFHPIYQEWRLHSGRDYAVACGTPVYAAADGTIISAGWGGGYGNRIVIDHGLVRGEGLASTYNHLSRIVDHGGQVSRGELIGYSGNTGTSTGCHLHFETLLNGNFADPRGWL